MSKSLPKVIVQNWEESERGWGTRPDGFTIHLNKEQLKEYIDWHVETNNDGDGVPDEYTRTCGSPVEVETTVAIYSRIASETMAKREGDKKKRAVNGVWGNGRYFDDKKLEGKHLQEKV